jgi:hypothetical protein
MERMLCRRRKKGPKTKDQRPKTKDQKQRPKNKNKDQKTKTKNKEFDKGNRRYSEKQKLLLRLMNPTSFFYIHPKILLV